MVRNVNNKPNIGKYFIRTFCQDVNYLRIPCIGLLVTILILSHCLRMGGIVSYIPVVRTVMVMHRTFHIKLYSLISGMVVDILSLHMQNDS